MNNADFLAVLELTKYCKTYEGQVVDNNDEFKRGRVRVSILDLGYEVISECPWCEPEMKKGLVVPQIGEWVVVWFMNGSVHRPIYRGSTTEKADNRLKTYVEPNTCVLLEDGLDTEQISVIYLRQEKKLTIKQDQKIIEVDFKENKALVNLPDSTVEITNGTDRVFMGIGDIQITNGNDTVSMNGGTTTINGSLEVDA